MEKGRFFALLSRMKYIGRWGLMRGTRTENLCEHSLETVYIAHALAEIHNTLGENPVDVKKAVLYAAYHDAQEVFTGDLPTPVKYRNPEIRSAYKAVEHAASERLLNSLPDDLRSSYEPFLHPDPSCLEWKLVKAADKLSGLIKCREELSFGNREFAAAEKAQLAAIKELNLPAAELFVKKYLSFYAESLDDLLET
ncbi:MAG TPA: 5'-deoxynucleotidase [Oscillospiraceae bacterium]|nr:5'-deoxynucleotidase [Oscillospiraceae bacterium]HPS33640.1 5'-deoxynucleotidase [Oscillospiraceae bacterium]